MKKSIFKTALMSAAVLSGVGLFANTAQANAAVKSSATNASQVRGVLTVVDHQKGEVHLYDRDGNVMKQTVKNGKAYKVWEKAMINGELMYRIGTDKQWIPAKYTNWDNAKVGQRVNIALPVKSAVSNRQNYAGAVRVNYQGQGKVRLLNDQGKYMPQYAAKNSTWRVWEKATINHEPMYRIGTQSQWIPAKYVAPVQTQTSAKAAPVVHANTNKQAVKPAIKPAKPTQSAQNHNAVKPSVPVANTQVNHNTNSAKPAVPAKPAKPATPVTPAKPSTNNQNTVKPSQPVKPAQPVTPSKPVTPTKPVQPTQPVKPTTPAKPVQPSQPVQTKTGLDAITDADAQQLSNNAGYKQGNWNDYNAASSHHNHYMDVTVYGYESKSDIYNDIKNEYNYWGWNQKSNETYAITQATKDSSNGTIRVTEYRY
ncbi:SLAP domain-containing protein [Lactobacillus gasseri]|uniref:SLAP domain-containing protein n=1 Tax=Lactobacillus gasseri TaxID=1596 RepID=UPI0011967298|nr:SLAP domain-containing protein [Lactobacillus gasseri]TVU93486.1 hypothetical protein FOF75_02510 [Lactobacillus gasseri]TVV14779.1 hypothetical protein FOF66_07105 [Lactobacillus gasseri]